MKDQATQLLKEVLSAFEPTRHLTVREVALRLDCSAKYVRKHLILFPNVWRMEGGGIRIPSKDVDAMIAERKIHKFKNK
jgi:hypothetical protein